MRVVFEMVVVDVLCDVFIIFGGVSVGDRDFVK